ALLDWAERAAMAVRVDESRHEQLGAVAHYAGARVRAAQCAPVADGGDAGAGHEHGRVAQDARLPRRSVCDHVAAADQEVHAAHSSAASFSMIVSATLVS